METKDFLKDGGYKSRKFWLCVITMVLVVAAAWVCPAPALESVIMGIVTVFTVYLGGNTVNRWNSGKIVAQAINNKEPAGAKALEEQKEEGA